MVFYSRLFSVGRDSRTAEKQRRGTVRLCPCPATSVTVIFSDKNARTTTLPNKALNPTIRAVVLMRLVSLGRINK